MKSISFSKTELYHIYWGNISTFRKIVEDISMVPKKLNGTHSLQSQIITDNKIIVPTIWNTYSSHSTLSTGIVANYKKDEVLKVSLHKMWKSIHRKYPPFIEIKITGAEITYVNNTYWWIFKFEKLSETPA